MKLFFHNKNGRINKNYVNEKRFENLRHENIIAFRETKDIQPTQTA